MINKILLGIIVVLALVGTADSLYALRQHYQPAYSSSCDINEEISCTAINQSEYSEMYGIPVSAAGAAGYLVIGIMAAGMLTRLLGQGKGMPLLLLLALGALGFSLWLTYAEIFIIKAVCPMCVISQGLIAAIAVLTLAAEVRRRRAGRVLSG